MADKTCVERGIACTFGAVNIVSNRLQLPGVGVASARLLVRAPHKAETLPVYVAHVCAGLRRLDILFQIGYFSTHPRVVRILTLGRIPHSRPVRHFVELFVHTPLG